ncbi:glycerate dehydrogenase, partial [Bradyrhizobium sp. PRIMUS42]|nr:glycerate dehydrogenase [Bradyrhizobium sp. PRIMUS42]
MIPDELAKIVFLDRDTMPSQINLRTFAFPHELREFGATKPDQVCDRVADAHIVITNKVPLSAAVVARARNLKLVAVAATGTDIVDLSACAARDITVSNIRNYATNTVPEHTFALVLALRRSLL